MIESQSIAAEVERLPARTPVTGMSTNALLVIRDAASASTRLRTNSSPDALSTERTYPAGRFRKVDIRQLGHAPCSEKRRAARHSHREQLRAEPLRNRAARRSVSRYVHLAYLVRCSRTVFRPAQRASRSLSSQLLLERNQAKVLEVLALEQRALSPSTPPIAGEATTVP